MMNRRSFVTVAWAAPCTALGAVAALVACALGASARRVSGVVEVAFDDDAHPAARALARLPFNAITLGHIVLARTHACQRAHRAHERVHVAQYERWGPLFFGLYLGSSVWQWLSGRRAYLDNYFEREARRLAGEEPWRAGVPVPPAGCSVSGDAASMTTPLRVSIPHQLGRAEAHRRIEGGFSKLAHQLPGGAHVLNPRWDGDRFTFSIAVLGQRVAGIVAVLDTVVNIEIELPGLLGQLAEVFKDKLQKAGTLLLTKD